MPAFELDRLLEFGHRPNWRGFDARAAFAKSDRHETFALGGFLGFAVKQPGLQCRSEVENAIADGDAAARRFTVALEYAVGQVLNWESVAGSLALSTQLRRVARCVSLGCGAADFEDMI